MTVSTTWLPTHPIDFAASIARYERWGRDAANTVHNGALHRVSASGTPYIVHQEPDGSITVTTDAAAAAEAMAETKWWLAEALDRQPLFDLAKHDEIVADLLTRFSGVRPPLQNAPFESLVGAITAQQVNLTWAATTRTRVVEAYGTPHEVGEVIAWEFPTPERLASVDPAELRAMQFTTRKAEYIVGLAQAATDGMLDGLEDLANTDVIERLVQIRGIGRWSAEWLLARCLARPDVIAAGDLGVRKAVSYHYRNADEALSEELVRDIAAPWGDATNLVTHLLLETLNT